MNERLPESVPQTPDLSLVDFDELWGEIRRRFDTVVMAGTKDLGEKKCQDWFRHSGSYLAGQGLCCRLVADIEDAIRENATTLSESQEHD